ncbi:MAG: carbamoyl-phosphate synthase large subunit, partial [Comamonadaceae bacterium]
MFERVLIANRGEIAVRLVRALRDLGVASVAVHARDDAQALHVRLADRSVALDATGPAAYLDVAALVAVALAQGCDAVHPGYGFLSERADFAQACADAGLVFIGPTVEQLRLFGDKARARALALECGVPVMPGSAGAVGLDEARAFFQAQQAQGAGVMLKAIGGGGGRGLRAVRTLDELQPAYERCVSEARAAFGSEGVYVERLMRRARHVEVQVLGDGASVTSLGERECTLQRRFQKLVEIAPSPSLPEALRDALTQAALRMARSVGYRGLGTFEFLVDVASTELPFVFIEANPRLQVEHTVTEAVTGLDLVQLQLGVAAGGTLDELGLAAETTVPRHGHAIQWRINAETLDAQGQARPAGGTLRRFDLPSGPGVRVDTHGQAGLTPSPHYDTLLAKLVVHSPSRRFADVLRRSLGALQECRIEGLATNLALLRAIGRRPEFETQVLDTGFVEDHLGELLAEAARLEGVLAAGGSDGHAQDAAAGAAEATVGGEQGIDPDIVRAPMPARLVGFDVEVGELLPAGAQLAVLEAMKMEHLLLARVAGRVLALLEAPGGVVMEGQPLLRLEPVDAEAVRAT